MLSLALLIGGVSFASAAECVDCADPAGDTLPYLPCAEPGEAPQDVWCDTAADATADAVAALPVAPPAPDGWTIAPPAWCALPRAAHAPVPRLRVAAGAHPAVPLFLLHQRLLN